MDQVKKKLAVYDLDGTLFDTGRVNWMAYREALEPVGAAVDYDYFCRFCNGRHYTEFVPAILGGQASPEVLQQIHAAKKAAYGKYLSHARMNQALFDGIRMMRDEYFIAIVTTASRKNTFEILEHFQVKDLFDLILTQEDITKVKPDPQGFVMAMEHFGIPADRTVIYEDSDVGIEAAVRSGASVLRAVQF
ncbi:MAG: HAD-IA family hydrolase [Lachnospiraceae bacterium]|nr:HAD-IA family hydrolase [Lachnospiraceae bacterium]